MLVDLELPIFDWLIFIRPRSDTVIVSRTAAVKNPEQAKNNNLATTFYLGDLCFLTCAMEITIPTSGGCYEN